MAWLWLIIPALITGYILVSAIIEIAGERSTWQVRVHVNGPCVWSGLIEEIVARYAPLQLEHPILLYQGDVIEVTYTEMLRGNGLRSITHRVNAPITMIWKQVDANIPPLPRALFIEGVKMEADGWAERSFPIGGYET